MYEDHWGLKKKAFSTVGDTAWYYFSPTHEEAQARLEYLVQHHRRLGVLIGPSGVGKTMSLNFFHQRLSRRAGDFALVSALGIGAEEFVQQVAGRLGASNGKQASTASAWQSLHGRLAENRFQQLPTVLLIDDAEQAEPDVLRALHRLIQVEAGCSSCLTVVLAVEAGRSYLLGQRLQEMCELKIELEVWDRWQTAGFLEWSLEAAGATEEAFTQDGLQRIYELAAGNPRRTVLLAELALTAAAGQQVEHVDAGLVDSAAEQLSLPAGAYLG